MRRWARRPGRASFRRPVPPHLGRRWNRPGGQTLCVRFDPSDGRRLRDRHQLTLDLSRVVFPDLLRRGVAEPIQQPRTLVLSPLRFRTAEDVFRQTGEIFVIGRKRTIINPRIAETTCARESRQNRPPILIQMNVPRQDCAVNDPLAVHRVDPAHHGDQDGDRFACVQHLPIGQESIQRSALQVLDDEDAGPTGNVCHIHEPQDVLVDDGCQNRRFTADRFRNLPRRKQLEHPFDRWHRTFVSRKTCGPPDGRSEHLEHPVTRDLVAAGDLARNHHFVQFLPVPARLTGERLHIS